MAETMGFMLNRPDVWTTSETATRLTTMTSPTVTSPTMTPTT
jgi:hypothetical protein